MSEINPALKMVFSPKEVCNQILAEMEEQTLAANGDLFLIQFRTQQTRS